MTSDTPLQARREQIVLDHFADETRQDFDAVRSADAPPRVQHGFALLHGAGQRQGLRRMRPSVLGQQAVGRGIVFR